jgi:hypothetical protein
MLHVTDAAAIGVAFARAGCANAGSCVADKATKMPVATNKHNAQHNGVTSRIRFLSMA